MPVSTDGVGLKARTARPLKNLCARTTGSSSSSSASQAGSSTRLNRWDCLPLMTTLLRHGNGASQARFGSRLTSDLVDSMSTAVRAVWCRSVSMRVLWCCWSLYDAVFVTFVSVRDDSFGCKAVAREAAVGPDPPPPPCLNRSREAHRRVAAARGASLCPGRQGARPCGR
jgi:hypothetical protein